MRNSTHIARLLEACGISNDRFVSFVLTSRHLTPRQRTALLVIVGGVA